MNSALLVRSNSQDWIAFRPGRSAPLDPDRERGRSFWWGQMSNDLLADALLVLHALIVAFNVGALPLIWLGHFRKWCFVRNFYFRLSHLLLIGLVAAESLLGLMCPLTTWEEALRSEAGGGARYPQGFIAHWLHRMIFFDLDQKYFTMAYVAFFSLVALTWLWVKPSLPRRDRATAPERLK